MKRFLIAQLVSITLFAIVALMISKSMIALSVVLGGAIALMNAVGTAFAWPRILEKKDVALALGIIVSKFALSLGVFYWLTTPSAASWFGQSFDDPSFAVGPISGVMVGFACGLASVLPAALASSAKDLSGQRT